MEFRVSCNNKGCMKENVARVDTKDMKAYCGECGKEISTISIFMRRQMVSFGQTKKNDPKKKLAWSVKCDKCKQEAPPVIKGERLFCSFCDEELDKIGKPFADILRAQLKQKKE